MTLQGHKPAQEKYALKQDVHYCVPWHPFLSDPHISYSHGTVSDFPRDFEDTQKEQKGMKHLPP